MLFGENVHLNWMNWFVFLIFIRGLIIIVIGSIDFSVSTPRSDVATVSFLIHHFFDSLSKL